MAVLLAIVTLTSLSQQAASRDNTRLTNTTTFADALEKYYEKNNEYPSTAALTDNGNAKSIAALTTLLPGISGESLRLPGNTSSLSSIFALSPSSSRIVYKGDTTAAGARTQCQNSSNTYASGYCDSFVLTFVNERNNSATNIKSRRTGFEEIIPVPLNPAAPTQPSIAISIPSGTDNIRFTAGPGACESGTVQYKIRYRTSGQMPDWDSVNWQTTTTKDLAGTINTTYYGQSLARCVENGLNSQSVESAVQTFATTCTAQNAPPYLNLSYSPYGNGTHYWSNLSWGASSGATGNFCGTTSYFVYNGGTLVCGPTNNMTNCATPAYQGSTNTFTAYARNRGGDSGGTSASGWAGPSINSTNININRYSNATFPIWIYNSATTNGYRDYLVAADSNTLAVCNVSAYTDGNGNGYSSCDGINFGDTNGNVCRTGRNFFLYDRTPGFAPETGRYNIANGFRSQPSINFESATKYSSQNGQRRYLMLRWGYSGEISYVQMRYRVNGGALQSIDNINENADDPNGYRLGDFAPGDNVEVWIYAANCNYKVASGSGGASGLFEQPVNSYVNRNLP